MRKFAYLKEPFCMDGHSQIYKIMLYQAEEGFYLFLYSSMDAVLCSSDLFYDSLEDIFEEWNDRIDDWAWIDMPDPLPGCQHDAIIPLRVKGRNMGKPEWGKYETLRDDEWVEI